MSDLHHSCSVTDLSLKFVSRILCKSFVKRRQDRGCGIDQLDSDLRCQEGVGVFELFAFDEVVQLSGELGAGRSSSDDDPGGQCFAICVAESAQGA